MSKRLILTSSLAGNILEFYDFSLYGIFSPVFAILFFPNTSPTTTFLASLATFGVGFFMRPLGGIVFGYIGDRLGRKKALSLSIILMAIPTLIVGFLPTYDQIGIVATVILIACRLLQGLCAGGEYNGASIFLIEHLGYRLSGLAGSLIASSGAIGSLLALSLGAFFLQSTMPINAWRIPFLLGAGFGIIGLYIRRHISETPEFTNAIKKELSIHPSLIQIWKSHLRAILTTIGIAALVGSLSSMLMIYMNIYLYNVMGFVQTKSLFFNSLELLIYIFIGPLAGWLSDKIGHLQMMIIGALGIFISIYPIFLLLQQESTIILIFSQLIFCLFACVFIAPSSAVMNTLFPVNIRYRCIALSYGIGIAAFGGSMPFICTLLIKVTQNNMMPAIYLMLCASISLGSIVFYWLPNVWSKKGSNFNSYQIKIVD